MNRLFHVRDETVVKSSASIHMPVQDTYKPLASEHDPSFEEFYRIYTESFPLSERKPKTAISAMLGRPDYRILLVERNGRPIGFSALFTPAAEPFSLVEYLAVQAAYRNSGVGGELFRQSVQAAQSGRDGLPALLEIDSDRELSPDREIRQRRQQFYRRLGCLRIEGFSYLLPLPGEGPPPEMDLMVHLPDRGAVIRKVQLKQWLTVVYQRVYNCSSGDPRIIRMMETVADPVRLV